MSFDKNKFFALLEEAEEQAKPVDTLAAEAMAIVLEDFDFAAMERESGLNELMAFSEEIDTVIRHANHMVATLEENKEVLAGKGCDIVEGIYATFQAATNNTLKPLMDLENVDGAEAFQIDAIGENLKSGLKPKKEGLIKRIINAIKAFFKSWFTKAGLAKRGLAKLARAAKGKKLSISRQMSARETALANPELQKNLFKFLDISDDIINAVDKELVTTFKDGNAMKESALNLAMTWEKSFGVGKKISEGDLPNNLKVNQIIKLFAPKLYRLDFPTKSIYALIGNGGLEDTNKSNEKFTIYGATFVIQARDNKTDSNDIVTVNNVGEELDAKLKKLDEAIKVSNFLTKSSETISDMMVDLYRKGRNTKDISDDDDNRSTGYAFYGNVISELNSVIKATIEDTTNVAMFYGKLTKEALEAEQKAGKSKGKQEDYTGEFKTANA